MSTKPPSGTRDFLPDDIRRREYVIGVIRDVYERYGFEPLETPAFENIETLLGKYGEEGNKLIFKILKRGEHEHTGDADLALRYDLTVPLARVVADNRGKLPRFFKRYQIQPVWRADRPQRGRFREFFQCDVDVIGSTSPVVCLHTTPPFAALAPMTSWVAVRKNAMVASAAGRPHAPILMAHATFAGGPGLATARCPAIDKPLATMTISHEAARRRFRARPAAARRPTVSPRRACRT